MVVLWLETQQKKAKVSLKLMASLAPAQAEIEAGVVAKADQKLDITQKQEVFRFFLPSIHD